MSTIKPAPGAMVPGTLTGAEFKTVRESLGLTTAWLATRLGVAERSVKRWDAGDSPVPPGVTDSMRSFRVEFDRQVASVVAAVTPGAVVPTFRTDVDARQRGLSWPSAWHRAVCARVLAEAPGVRLAYDEVELRQGALSEDLDGPGATLTLGAAYPPPNPGQVLAWFGATVVASRTWGNVMVLHSEQDSVPTLQISVPALSLAQSLVWAAQDVQEAFGAARLLWPFWPAKPSNEQWEKRVAALNANPFIKAIAEGLGIPATAFGVRHPRAGVSWWDTSDPRRGDSLVHDLMVGSANTIVQMSPQEVAAELDTDSGGKGRWARARWGSVELGTVWTFLACVGLAAVPVRHGPPKVGGEPTFLTSGTAALPGGHRLCALPLPPRGRWVESDSWLAAAVDPATVASAVEAKQTGVPQLLGWRAVYWLQDQVTNGKVTDWRWSAPASTR